MASKSLRVIGGEQDAPVTLVDSCVLLDIALDDAKWADWSAAALTEAANAGPLAINPIIYAEVSAGYATIEETDEFLAADDFRREPLPYPAGFLAGKAFVQYRRSGGIKKSPLPDFYIGAHAAVSGYRLLTRDVGRYATYFPKLTLIIP